MNSQTIGIIEANTSVMWGRLLRDHNNQTN